jgi:hypothetical protein
MILALLILRKLDVTSADAIRVGLAQAGNHFGAGSSLLDDFSPQARICRLGVGASFLERVVNFSASFVMPCFYLLPLLDRGRLISWNEGLTRMMSVAPNGRLSRRI